MWTLLTLSAIHPRTLTMAMSGIRDCPAGGARRPPAVQTTCWAQLGRARDAMRRRWSGAGEVLLFNNRGGDLRRAAARSQDAGPEVRVAVPTALMPRRRFPM
jgi:transcription-repair coupling factor (superfamily II helicase)